MDKREELLRYYMDNPCLSEPMDYENDTIRLEYYSKVVSEYSDEEVMEQLSYID